MSTTAILPAFEQPVDRAAELAGRPGVVRFLEMPVRRAVMVDGTGAPGPEAFTPRMPALYTTAYTLRFALKKRGVVDKVGPLEGLWWTLDGTTDLDAIFGEGPRGDWRWTIFIGLPDAATPAEIEAALAAGRAKVAEPMAATVRVEAFAEGRVAQLLHLGPYAAERASIEQLHAAIVAAGLRPRGQHHEIYLGNPQTSAPERLRTILRQAVE
jgi:hypothetical protein